MIDKLNRPHIKYNFLSYCGMGILFTAWVILMYIGYLMLIPVHVIDITEYRILDKEVVQGDSIIYEISYCKYRSIEGETQKSFVNGLIFYIPDQDSNVPVGCHTARNVLDVPIELPPGTYRINRITKYTPNPFQIVRVEVNSNTFKVLEREDN